MLTCISRRAPQALLQLLLAACLAPAASGSEAPENSGPTGDPASGSATVDPARRGARPALVTDPNVVFSIPSMGRPSYLIQTSDPVFTSPLVRIAGSIGSSTSPVSGTWGSDARHGYSKRQPWNADMSLVVLDNRSGGSPSTVYLDGLTFLPKSGPPSGYSAYDWRWHPSTSHKNEQINVNSSGSELMWYDVIARTKTRTWTLPFSVNSLGSGEGNVSHDGRFALLADDTRMFLVDMDPQPPYAAYPSKRIGPARAINECGVSTCSIDWVSISPSGRYAVVSYSGDYVRVYDVNPSTLALTPRPMPSGSTRCHGTAANGFIYDLGHADMALDPFDGNEDVIIGQEHCGNRGKTVNGQAMGSVIKVRLRDGQVTSLTSPSNEAYAHHVSTRNLGRPGWAYVGYYKDSGKRFSDEVVAVKLDGSKTVERLAHKRSTTSGCYRCESHAVPSPDGLRVMFASNWAQDCGSGCMPTSDIKAYVVTRPGSEGLDAGPPSPRPGSLDVGELALSRCYPNPFRSLATVELSLPNDAPAQLELIDVTGRIVQSRDLRSAGAGPQTVPFGPVIGARPGVYWLRLRQSDRVATLKVVLNRP